MTPSEIPTWPEDEVRSRLDAELPEWTYDRGWLRRDVPTSGWPAALTVANLLAHLAEAAYHHPDLEVGPDGVRIRVRHHWAAGITEGDFQLARAVEEFLEGRPADPQADG